MQMLIEGARIEISEYNYSELGGTIVENDFIEQLKDSETKRQSLERKMLELEEEASVKDAEMIEKDREISRLKQRLENFETSLLSGQEMVASSVNGITQMEAQIQFAAKEKEELE